MCTSMTPPVQVDCVVVFSCVVLEFQAGIDIFECTGHAGETRVELEFSAQERWSSLVSYPRLEPAAFAESVSFDCSHAFLLGSLQIACLLALLTDESFAVCAFCRRTRSTCTRGP